MIGQADQSIALTIRNSRRPDEDRLYLQFMLSSERLLSWSRNGYEIFQTCGSQTGRSFLHDLRADSFLPVKNSILYKMMYVLRFRYCNVL